MTGIGIHSNPPGGKHLFSEETEMWLDFDRTQIQALILSLPIVFVPSALARRSTSFCYWLLRLAWVLTSSMWDSMFFKVRRSHPKLDHHPSGLYTTCSFILPIFIGLTPGTGKPTVSGHGYSHFRECRFRAIGGKAVVWGECNVYELGTMLIELSLWNVSSSFVPSVPCRRN
jgi:hypothetical protein